MSIKTFRIQGIIQKKYGHIGFLQNKKQTCQRHIKWQLEVWGALLNCYCGMVDRQKAFSLISSWDHCQRSSPSRISDRLRAGFEPAQNLSSGLVEWSCAVVITTTPLHPSRGQGGDIKGLSILLFFSCKILSELCILMFIFILTFCFYCLCDLFHKIGVGLRLTGENLTEAMLTESWTEQLATYFYRIFILTIAVYCALKEKNQHFSGASLKMLYILQQSCSFV